LGHQVLERALLYEMPPESVGQEETLRRVLQGFIDHGLVEKKARGLGASPVEILA